MARPSVGSTSTARVIEADAVVIAMGPWSALARRWLPVPDVYGLKGHSIVLRPSAPVPAEALFADVQTEGGLNDTPEIFPRPDGTVYLCGLSSQDPLPEDPALVATDSAASDQLRAMAGMLSPLLSDADIRRYPGLLSACDTGRTAGDGSHSGNPRRLYRNRSQRLGVS